VDRISNHSAVRNAQQFIDTDHDRIVREIIAINEIPAPPFKEGERARAFAQMLKDSGLTNVEIDPEGNVLGLRKGTGSGPLVAVAAHLDTVFPEGTEVRVKREGNRLLAPGVGDNARSLAVVLAIIRALESANVQTTGDILFVGDVGEEGPGDLRGIKYLFQKSRYKDRIRMFVSIDGAGNGSDIVNGALGSRRYRVVFRGPGGHSYGAFGMANPIQAMGRAIAKIDAFQVPAQPKTTFNVGRVGGGTSVNAIPFEAWMEVDMRSADAASLQDVDNKFQAAIKEAVAEENARWQNKGAITAAAELVGVRPPGITPKDSPIVQTAMAVSRAMRLEEVLREGSTDSNVPMNLGIPAITISGGGIGTGAHSLNEAFDAKDSWRGTQRALLLVIALAR
jgi:acetylornithine deacetylase/succinyl-diaminopimelate desuccinylase-like protein